MRLSLTRVLSIALCLCTSLWGIILPAGAVSAQGETLIHLAPTPAQVGEGRTTAVEVRVENVQELYGLDVRLSFDPAAVEVADADPVADGTQVQPGDLLSVDFVLRNEADNEEGTIWFALTQVNPSPEVSGSGVAFIITFVGKDAGSSPPVSITYAKIVERNGEEIPASTEDGEMQVVEPEEAPPEPTQAPPPSQPTLVTPTQHAAPTPTPTPTALPPETSAEPTSTDTPTPTAIPGATRPAATNTPAPTRTVPATTPSPTSTSTPTPGPTSEPTQTSDTPVPTGTGTATPAASVAEAETPQTGPTQVSSSPTNEPGTPTTDGPPTLLILAIVAGIAGLILLSAGIVWAIRAAR